MQINRIQQIIILVRNCTVLCKRSANEIFRNKRNYRLSAIKLRNFSSDEKAAKFRCFYRSNVGEISQAR